jgi:hypothetical protein
MQKLVIIPVDSQDSKYDWHLHAEDCQDVNKSYDFTQLNSVWTVSSITDARETLQNDWIEFEDNAKEIYDFDRNVKIFGCAKELERVGA